MWRVEEEKLKGPYNASRGRYGGGWGETERHPPMLENLQLRWSLIRKVYPIITVQLLLTIAVASVAVFVRPVALFFVGSIQALCPLKFYHQKYPLNYFPLIIFTVNLAFTNGLGCAFESKTGYKESNSGGCYSDYCCGVKPDSIRILCCKERP